MLRPEDWMDIGLLHRERSLDQVDRPHERVQSQHGSQGRAPEDSTTRVANCAAIEARPLQGVRQRTLRELSLVGRAYSRRDSVDGIRRIDRHPASVCALAASGGGAEEETDGAL